jgi:hypothetical protein
MASFTNLVSCPTLQIHLVPFGPDSLNSPAVILASSIASAVLTAEPTCSKSCRCLRSSIIFGHLAHLITLAYIQKSVRRVTELRRRKSKITNHRLHVSYTASFALPPRLLRVWLELPSLSRVTLPEVARIELYTRKM